jgi:CO/xanthine dehydrogenase FAD-binding subunit
MGRYERPPRIEEALEILSAGDCTLLAGGTDFYPARVGRAITEDVLDLTGIEGLRGIAEQEHGWRIGALTTWSDLIASELPVLFDGYKRAAREVGGRQIQNTGTLVGNLCNASPAADGTPNLMALDALVELQSLDGARLLPVAQFVRGNRKTQRDVEEIVTALIIPRPRRVARSAFRKLGARKYLVISIVMVAAVIEESSDGRVAQARVCVGSCNAVSQRLPLLESALNGVRLNRLAAVVQPRHLAPLDPISDVRGSADYRRDAAFELVCRTLAEFAPC